MDGRCKMPQGGVRGREMGIKVEPHSCESGETINKDDMERQGSRRQLAYVRCAGKAEEARGKAPRAAA
eukprot:scaffold282842_cov33-Tisochrysis_lutea.AAC.3